LKKGRKMKAKDIFIAIILLILATYVSQRLTVEFSLTQQSHLIVNVILGFALFKIQSLFIKV
jgi:hypothetical protein